MIGVVDLVVGKSYTIDFGNGTTFANQQIKSFGLVIEEILDVSTDTFSFDDNSLKQLKIVNVNTNGNTQTGIWLENKNNSQNADIILGDNYIDLKLNGNSFNIINDNSETHYK